MATSMPLQYKRLYKGPLDEDQVFNSMELAMTYASSPTAYPGQVIGVKKDNGEWGSFLIGEGGTLTEQLTMEDMTRMISWIEMR